jgi:hypothetical protein
MDLKLKSLKSQLELCNDKLEVIDYVYYKYDRYLDNNIKEYISLRHTMLELNINNLIDEIDNTYREMENYILDKIDIIQKDIDKKERQKKIKNKIAKGMMSYAFMTFLLANENILEKKNTIDEEIAKLEAELADKYTYLNNVN